MLAPGPVSPPSQGHRPHLPPTITTQIPPQNRARNRTAPSPRPNPGRGQLWEHIQLPTQRRWDAPGPALSWPGCVPAPGCTPALRVSTGMETGIHTGMQIGIHTDIHTEMHPGIHTHTGMHTHTPRLKPHTGTATLLPAEVTTSPAQSQLSTSPQKTSEGLKLRPGPGVDKTGLCQSFPPLACGGGTGTPGPAQLGCAVPVAPTPIGVQGLHPAWVGSGGSGGLIRPSPGSAGTPVPVPSPTRCRCQTRRQPERSVPTTRGPELRL